MARRKITAPGHKLGQIVGRVLELALRGPLRTCAASHGCYRDIQGDRPSVRSGKKVRWLDAEANPHDLDFVFERGGSDETRGEPVAFIEAAWRRYTKHSRNKAGELLGALLPLKQTYGSTRFLGVVLAGEFTQGGIQQLQMSGVQVLHVDFGTVKSVFEGFGANIDYPEGATATDKRKLNSALESLAKRRLPAVAETLFRAISADYGEFEAKLALALARRTARVRIIALYGEEMVFGTAEEAIQYLARVPSTVSGDLSSQGYEIFVEFSTGSEVRGRFHSRQEAVEFLRRVD